MQWIDMLANVNVLASNASRPVEISGVHYDSRRVQSGEVFVAMGGESTDGNQHIEYAIANGAAAVVTDSRKAFEHLSSSEFPSALVAHGRRALAEVSSAVFGRPQDKLNISAVTGTNGKTTTAFLLEQMLTSAGRKCVLVGTIETHIGGDVRASEHTTPESRDLLALFAEGVAAGCTEVVMEMSSHALEQERVWGIPVDVAMFTNLTQDHLDYHGTMEKYAEAKARMFRGVGAPAPRIAVINADDPAALQMVAATVDDAVVTYGIDAGAWRAKSVALRAGGTYFVLQTPLGEFEMRSPLTGRVNVYNLLAAVCAASARGLRMSQIVSATEALRQVPGRFEVVLGSRAAGFTVVVDYAHTEDALINLIGLGRGLVQDDGGRVITMFGCGGERDVTKRPKMGRVAGENSDLVVVTSDNPRREDPRAIIDQILEGMRDTSAALVVEQDRRAAIEVAIRAARPGDIVLLAGKGHEKVQIFAEGGVPFDDVAEAARVLRILFSEETR